MVCPHPDKDNPRRSFSQLAPDVLHHAERLHEAMRQYESVVAPADYRINQSHLVLFRGLADPAVKLEAALTAIGFDPSWPILRVEGACDTNVYTAVLAVGELAVEIRLSRHATTPEQRAEALAGWASQGNAGWGFVPGMDVVLPQLGSYADRLAAHIELLRAATGNAPEQLREQNPAATVSPVSSRDDTPANLLFGWGAILHALGRRDTRREQRLIKNVNELCNGPIRCSGRGSRSVVNKDTLLTWWNGLEDFYGQTRTKEEKHQDNCEASVKGRHNYGRDGEVVPEIEGGTKRRRHHK
jgi:hypothetical protein